MAQEQDDKQESIDQDKLAEDAAFEAAMNGDDEPEVEEEVVSDTPESEDHQEAEDSVESNDQSGDDAVDDKHVEAERTDEQKPERVEVIPGYTKEELDEHLSSIPQMRKAIDTQNGTYGKKFQQQETIIKSLQSQLQQTSANTTQKEQKEIAKLTGDTFKSLKQAGFDELAESLANDFNEILANLNGGNNTDTQSLKEEILGQVNNTIEGLSQKNFEADLDRLNSEHPDWHDIASFNQTKSGLVIWKDKRFGEWVSQQPEEMQLEILDSGEPLKVAKWISEFKNSIKTTVDETHEQPKPKPTNSRLRKAVNPKGVTASRQLSEKQEEDEAFRRAMAGED
ncbi:MAG: hypothetical protein H6937_02435 [Burkholderiales bacterium]|nr:hypothetical protein [Burkholderiales bacterium]